MKEIPVEHKEKDFSLSWFFKWFVDNKAITVFLVALLMGLNILVLSKISFIFTPLLEFGAANHAASHYFRAPLLFVESNRRLFGKAPGQTHHCNFHRLYLDCSSYFMGLGCRYSSHSTSGS